MKRKRKPLRRKLQKESGIKALENIEVEEISFVPKGANKKKLLVVKGEKKKMAVPYKQFGIAGADHPWEEEMAVQRLREASTSDGMGAEDSINWEKFKDFFLYQSPDNMESLDGYKLPIADIADNTPKIVPAALHEALAAVRGDSTGIDLSEEDKAAILERLKKHFADAGIEFPEEESGMEEDSMLADPEKEKEEVITDTLQETPFPPETATEGQEALAENTEKQPHLIHPEFKAQCQEIADLLAAKVNELKAQIDAMQVIDKISLADAEDLYGYRFGRMDLYELPLEASGKVTEINALANKMQDKIPWSMRICKEFMELADKNEETELSEEKVMKMVGIEKISTSQRSIAAAAISLLSHLATPQSSKPSTETEENTEEIDKEKEKAEKEKENQALKSKLGEVQKELEVTRQMLQKSKSAPVPSISRSQSSGGSTPQKEKEEKVSWPSDMAAKFRK